MVKMYLQGFPAIVITSGKVFDLWSQPDSEVFGKNILTQGMTNGHGS